jgi:cobalt-zinc-cadmium efflux system protein
MQMAPAQLNVDEIRERLTKEEALENIHHIHIWNLTDKLIHFECHLILKNDLKISETNEIYNSVREILHDEFQIEHVTIQFETENGTGCDC